MKKIFKLKPQGEKSIDLLKRIAKRVEEATVDISDIKRDIKFTDIRLSNVEHNTKLMKVDMEKMRGDIEEVQGDISEMKKDINYLKRNTDDITKTTAEILQKAATQEDVAEVSQRVTVLEQS